ncbi:MAG TPA: hypothetical protein VFE72_03840 [Lysobacter sp.]|nr:hypothetical protein [Lysobacter sp.]
MHEHTTDATVGPGPDRNTSAGAQSPTRRFEAHNLGVYCFDVWGCEVTYGNRVVWKESPTALKPPLEIAMPRGRSLMRGTQGVFRGFEGPLSLQWHDLQRRPHRLQIDLSDVFPDRRLRHAVRDSDISTDATIGPPDIIVEIEDRTVRLYMRATIPLKQSLDPANPRRNVAVDLVPVYEHLVGQTP